MAAFAIDHSEQIELAASERKAVAKKHFDAIRKSGTQLSRASMVIGWNAYRLKSQNLFGILGFSTEHEARIAAGVGDSTWYANIRLAEEFRDLTEEQFVSMKQANAKALADLPESTRYDSMWIRDAGTMPVEEFQAKIDAEMDGKAKPSDGKEQSVVLKFPMPASRKKAIDAGLQELTKQMGIEEGDPGKVLEIVIAERTGQMGLVEAITNASQRVKRAKEVMASDKSAEEQLAAVDRILDEMVMDFEAALDALGNQSEEVA